MHSARTVLTTRCVLLLPAHTPPGSRHQPTPDTADLWRNSNPTNNNSNSNCCWLLYAICLSPPSPPVPPLLHTLRAYLCGHASSMHCHLPCPSRHSTSCLPSSCRAWGREGSMLSSTCTGYPDQRTMTAAEGQHIWGAGGVEGFGTVVRPHVTVAAAADAPLLGPPIERLVLLSQPLHRGARTRQAPDCEKPTTYSQ